MVMPSLSKLLGVKLSSKTWLIDLLTMLRNWLFQHFYKMIFEGGEIGMWLIKRGGGVAFLQYI